MRPTRRALLLGAAGGAVLVGLGALVGWPRRPAPGFRVLSTGEVDVLRAVLRAFFPPGGPVGPDPVAVGADVEADRLLAEVLSAEARDGVRALLRALQWGTLLSRGLPFTALSPADRAHVLEVWSSREPPPRRFALDGLRSLAAMAYFSRPEVRRAIGWRGRCGVRR